MNVDDFLENPKAHYDINKMLQLTLYKSIETNVRAKYNTKLLLEIKAMLSDTPESETNEKLSALALETEKTIHEAYRKEVAQEISKILKT